MLHHELDEEKGVLTITPDGPLTAEDFKALAPIVDPYIESHGGLTGLVIDVAKFPGWQNWDAFTTHMRFIRNHEREIGHIAVITDSTVLTLAPELIKHFLKAEVRHFRQEQRAEALAWVAQKSPTAG